MNNVKKNSVYVLQRKAEVYYIHDESSAYPRQGRLLLEEPTSLVVTALTKAPWVSVATKPEGLVRAMITSGPYAGRLVTVTKKTLLKAGTAA